MLTDPPELGNEDLGFLLLLDRAAFGTDHVCLCAHPESDHPGGMCIRKLCGCVVFRPDPRVPSPETVP